MGAYYSAVRSLAYTVLGVVTGRSVAGADRIPCGTTGRLEAIPIGLT